MSLFDNTRTQSSQTPGHGDKVPPGSATLSYSRWISCLQARIIDERSDHNLRVAFLSEDTTLLLSAKSCQTILNGFLVQEVLNFMAKVSPSSESFCQILESLTTLLKKLVKSFVSMYLNLRNLTRFSEVRLAT